MVCLGSASIRTGETGSLVSAASVTHAMEPQARNLTLIDDAIATYQTASWLFKHAAQRELSREEFNRCFTGEN